MNLPVEHQQALLFVKPYHNTRKGSSQLWLMSNQTWNLKAAAWNKNIFIQCFKEMTM